MVPTWEDSRRVQKTNHRSGAQPTAMWGCLAYRWGRSAPVGPTYQPALYVGSPPPLSMHLRCCLSRFDPRAHVGPLGLYIPAPAPLPQEIPKTLIHILLMRIRASYQEKISPS